MQTRSRKMVMELESLSPGGAALDVTVQCIGHVRDAAG